MTTPMQKRKLLNRAVSAKVAYWKAMNALEKVTSADGEWTDKESNLAEDFISDLAVGGASYIRVTELNAFLVYIRK